MNGVIIFLEILILLVSALLLVRSINHDNRITGLERVLKRVLYGNPNAMSEVDGAGDEYTEVIEPESEIVTMTDEET